MDMRPYGIKMSKRVVAHFKEEVSVFSFVVDSKGIISDINDKIQMKIRPVKPGEMSNFIDGNGNRALRRVPYNRDRGSQ